MQEKMFIPDQPKNDESRHEDNLDLDRRKFLKQLGGVVGGAVLAETGIGLSHPAKEIIDETIFKKETEAELAELEKEILEKYGVRLDFQAMHEAWLYPKETGKRVVYERIEDRHSTELTLAEKRDAALEVSRVLGMYPTRYREKMNLTKIRLLKELATNRESQEDGFVSARIPGTIVANKERHSLGGLIEDHALGWGSGDHLRGILHHECFHAAEQLNAPNGEAENRLARGYIDWEKLNTELGGLNYTGTYLQGVEKFRPKGFVNGYSRSYPWEDRAEITRLLYTDPRRLKKIIAEDPIVAEKVKKVKAWLESASDGVIDEEYWSIVEREKPETVAAYVRAREALKI